MLLKICSRITYANVAMTLALVLAMSGGAYAAKKYLVTSIKQISPKVVSQLRGKEGSQGPAGPQGPQGPAGKDGANGTTGKDGLPGKDGVNVTSSPLTAGKGGCAAGGVAYTSVSGTNSVCHGEKGEPGTAGSNGKSLTVASEPKGSNCEQGGASIEVEGTPASKKYVCNGSPWPAGGTLPKGATETGVYDITGSRTIEEFQAATMSFPIHLSSAILESHVIYVKPGEVTPTHCTGNVETPGAEEGYLCVFGLVEFDIAESITHFSLSTGAALFFKVTTTGTVYAAGTWAVTSE